MSQLVECLSAPGSNAQHHINGACLALGSVLSTIETRCSGTHLQSQHSEYEGIKIRSSRYIVLSYIVTLSPAGNT